MLSSLEETSCWQLVGDEMWKAVTICWTNHWAWPPSQQQCHDIRGALLITEDINYSLYHMMLLIRKTKTYCVWTNNKYCRVSAQDRRVSSWNISPTVAGSDTVSQHKRLKVSGELGLRLRAKVWDSNCCRINSGINSRFNMLHINDYKRAGAKLELMWESKQTQHCCIIYVKQCKLTLLRETSSWHFQSSSVQCSEYRTDSVLNTTDLNADVTHTGLIQWTATS